MPRKRASGLTTPQEEFAAWLRMTKRERQLHDLPPTQNDWAAWKGVTPRTVSRWKHRDDFREYFEQQQVAAARKVPGSTVTAEDFGGARSPTDARSARRVANPAPATEADDPVSRYAHVEDERYRSYLEAKAILMEGVRAGNDQMTKTFFQLFGKDFIDAESAGSERLVDLSDEQLVEELITLLGPDAVAERLAAMAAA